MVLKDCDSSEASSQSPGFGDGSQGPESSWGLISRRRVPGALSGGDPRAVPLSGDVPGMRTQTQVLGTGAAREEGLQERMDGKRDRER